MFTFNLENGLQLEDREIFLPWGATCDDLAALSPSTIQDAPTASVFVWADTCCLSGLFADVRIELVSGRQLRKLMVCLRADGPPFESISQHLERAFGPPVRRSVSEYPAMVRSEEFLDCRNTVAHYGRTEDYFVHGHGLDRGQELIIRLRDDCKITKSAE
jgi:hypothetical protein